jgi:hypothetical protein
MRRESSSSFNYCKLSLPLGAHNGQPHCFKFITANETDLELMEQTFTQTCCEHQECINDQSRHWWNVSSSRFSASLVLMRLATRSVMTPNCAGLVGSSTGTKTCVPQKAFCADYCILDCFPLSLAAAAFNRRRLRRPSFFFPDARFIDSRIRLVRSITRRLNIQQQNCGDCLPIWKSQRFPTSISKFQGWKRKDDSNPG